MHSSSVMVTIILVASILLSAAWVKGKKLVGYECLILWVAIILRCVYSLGTMASTRAYDVSSHLFYIEYVYRTGGFPNSIADCGSHHPPLYYFIFAQVLSFFLGSNGFSADSAFAIGKNIALLLSVGSVFVAVESALLIFPLLTQHRSRLLLLIPSLFLPGVVYMASRISNDTLLYFLAQVAILLLIRWYLKPLLVPVGMYATIASAALLTKISGIIFFCPLILAVCVHSNLSRTQKIKSGMVVAVTTAALTGWYFVRRLIIENADSFAAIRRCLDEKLRVENKLVNFVTFNPISVVTQPFTDTRDLFLGKNNFWEFLFRSTLFGEWQHTMLGTFVPAMAAALFIVLLMLAFYNAVRIFCSRHHALHWILFSWLGFALLTLLVFRIMEPFSCHQDFRLIGFATLGFGILLTAKPSTVSMVVALSAAVSWVTVIIGVVVFTGT